MEGALKVFFFIISCAPSSKHQHDQYSFPNVRYKIYNKVEANILLKHMVYWALSEYMLAGSRLRRTLPDLRGTSVQQDFHEKWFFTFLPLFKAGQEISTECQQTFLFSCHTFMLLMEFILEMIRRRISQCSRVEKTISHTYSSTVGYIITLERDYRILRQERPCWTMLQCH